MIGDLLQRLHPTAREERQLDVHRRPDRGAQVGRAEGEPAEPLVRGEGHEGVHVLDPVDQQLEHAADVAAGSHGDDPEVVLLPDPHQEGLLLVVEDSSPCWPVSACVGRLQMGMVGNLGGKITSCPSYSIVMGLDLQEPVALLEKKMVVNQLLLDLVGHSGQRVIGSYYVLFKNT